MKINFPKEVVGVEISSVSVGKAFLADRKSSNEKGLYMKVDRLSGLATVGNDYCLAVNLQSGQLRRFYRNVIVTPAATEINFIKEDRIIWKH